MLLKSTENEDSQIRQMISHMFNDPNQKQVADYTASFRRIIKRSFYKGFKFYKTFTHSKQILNYIGYPKEDKCIVTPLL